MRLLSLKTVSLLMLLSTVAFNFAIFEVTREDTGSEDVGALETAAEANPTIQRAQQFAKKFEELYKKERKLLVELTNAANANLRFDHRVR